ncbi:MAG: SGNH/GDSL hydrolase family protein [Lachnospiraceae bacterium]|nr:SGNH/GDSL hydrolase family protein [Lachnospiraceae bacterium]
MKKDNIDWIDLDIQDDDANTSAMRDDKPYEKEDFYEDFMENEDEDTEEDEDTSYALPGKKGGFNFHLIAIGLIAVILLVIIVKLVMWNIGEKDDDTIDNSEHFNTEAMDNIVPLDASDISETTVDDDLNILFLGNGQLARNKASEDNLANIIKRKTGANKIYNCAIDGSYMSMINETYKGSFIYDAFSFYMLTTTFTVDNQKILKWARRDLTERQGGVPADVEEALATLSSVDFDELDTICIYYDSSDYQKQQLPFDDANSSNVNTYAGALEAGLLLIKETYPHVRIIVMSPTFCYYVDDNGDYYSAYDESMVDWPMYVYVIHEQDTCYLNNVTFVDNFYGSIYGEIADKYLIDNVNLNRDGNELLADRFIYALNRFNEYDFSAYE